eukprot:SAG25_NODE_12256_length_284_cov_0.540541_1_plen_38_part_10
MAPPYASRRTHNAMRPDNAHTTGVQWKKPSNETELTRP